MSFTPEQVLAMSPDAGSAKKGQELANGRKWSNTGTDAETQTLWGECAGSGSKPYQTAIDLNGPAFKCSCPSHKFPCKHGIGLFLYSLNTPGAFASTAPPPWVADWAAKRANKTEAKAKATTEPVSEAEQQKRAQLKASREQSRVGNIQDGVADLQLWLRDTVRTGIASVETQRHTFSNDKAARLVDAQAGTLATAVRYLGSQIGNKAHWHANFLMHLGELYVLCQAFQQMDALPPALQAEVRARVGLVPKKEAVAAEGENVRDTWHVLSVVYERDERLNERRVWMHGTQTGRMALLLDFAFGAAPFEPPMATGQCIEAQVAYFPGAYPQRAILVEAQSRTAPPPPPGGTVAQALAEYAHGLGVSPWLRLFPVRLFGLPVFENGQWHWADDQNEMLKLALPDGILWRMVALCGGHPTTLFGEWDGEVLRPLTVTIGSQLVPLNELF